MDSEIESIEGSIKIVVVGSAISFLMMMVFLVYVVFFEEENNPMMSPLPWRLDPDDPARILDGNDQPVAEGNRFLNLDDFEGLPPLVNRAGIGSHRFTDRYSRELPDGVVGCGCPKCGAESSQLTFYHGAWRVCRECSYEGIIVTFCPWCGVKLPLAKIDD